MPLFKQSKIMFAAIHYKWSKYSSSFSHVYMRLAWKKKKSVIYLCAKLYPIISNESPVLNL